MRGENDRASQVSGFKLIPLMLYTAGWFSFSVLYNTSTKIIVNLCPNHVALITTVQLLFALFFVGLPGKQIRATALVSPVEVLLWGFVVSLGQYLGNLFGNLAVADLSVSLLNIIKSGEPAVALLYCFAFFGQRETASRIAALVLLTCGIVLCNFGDFTFTWQGCTFCLLSNLFHVIKGVYSKRYFVDRLGWAGDDLFFLSTFGSVLLGAPALVQHADLSVMFAVNNVLPPLMLSCASYYCNSWCAFKLMSCVSPVTYSLLNVYKRLFILLVLLTVEHSWNCFTMGGLALTAIGLLTFSR